LVRKECFGSIKELILRDGLAQIQTKPECRECQEFRDCLHYSKQPTEEREDRDELRKQEMIAKIIDLSHILSNEIGSCLLEFLNRIYNSTLGTILFKNLLLFYEIQKDISSSTLTIPIFPSTLDLIQGKEAKVEHSLSQTGMHQRESSQEGFSIHIVLIQRPFSNNRKANTGLITHEIARLFSTNSQVIKQILQTLTNSEIDQFKKMDIEDRISWLMGKWGFLDEFEAFKKERALLYGRGKD
jgi:hypothetical protein